MRSIQPSLLTRVLSASLARSALSITGLTAFFLWSYSHDLQRQLLQRAAALADFLAAQSQFAMLVGDTQELERIARNAIASDQVQFVEFRDEHTARPVLVSRPGAPPRGAADRGDPAGGAAASGRRHRMGIRRSFARGVWEPCGWAFRPKTSAPARLASAG